MKSPTSVKEVQQLTGKLAALGRFLPAAADRSRPLYDLLRKGKTFKWSEEAEQIFADFKESLGSPPVLTNPTPREALYFYLEVRDHAISAVLIRETPEGQRPVY